MDIEQQYDKLLRYCYVKLRDRAMAEDITQEAFIRFLESSKYQNTGKEMAYLYTIARNLCIDCYRKQREELFDDLPSELDGFPDLKDEMSEIVERMTIERALDSLADDEREIVILRYMSDLSIKSIGEALNMSRFSVRRRISSAMAKLRKEMDVNEEF